MFIRTVAVSYRTCPHVYHVRMTNAEWSRGILWLFLYTSMPVYIYAANDIYIHKYRLHSLTDLNAFVCVFYEWYAHVIIHLYSFFTVFLTQKGWGFPLHLDIRSSCFLSHLFLLHGIFSLSLSFSDVNISSSSSPLCLFLISFCFDMHASRPWESRRSEVTRPYLYTNVYIYLYAILVFNTLHRYLYLSPIDIKSIDI